MHPLRPLIFFLLLLLGAAPLHATAPAAKPTPSATQMSAPVLYDKNRDTLSVEANAVPLKDILGYIAIQSGIEVLFDSRADRPVTAKFRGRPFEEALKNLLKESNYSLRYSEAKKGKKPLLIGMKVLPNGEKDGKATPLMLLQGEAYIQEKNHRSEGDNLSYDRWKARLAELPPKLQEEVQKHAKNRLDKQAKEKAEREKRHEKARAKRQQQQAEQHARRQAILDAMSPEDRALAEQRRENARKMAQQNNNNNDN